MIISFKERGIVMDYSIYPKNDIICIDCLSFYASVEAVRLGFNPLKVLLAVVGDPSRRGSIVLAASPQLKKRYGIKNVSRFYELPDDPEIIIVKANMKYYLEMSIQITKMMMEYVPIEAIHQYSIDELWITANGLNKRYRSTLEVAKAIKKEIYQRYGLITSIGIGDNKFLAKVVMDVYGKRKGIAECRYEDVENMLWPIPIGKVWGIGFKMEKKLKRLGIDYLGQLANFPLQRLKNLYGVIGEQLYWHAWGIDLSPVYGDFFSNEQKNYGHGITLLRDYTEQETKTCILDLCEEVCKRARTAGKAGKTIHLRISYSQEGGFSRSKTITQETNITMEMYEVCLQIFNKLYDGHSLIRYVHVSLGKLYKVTQDNVQLSLFENKPKQNDLGYTMDKIRDRFGPTAILRASSYTKAGITLEKSKKIGGHYA